MNEIPKADWTWIDAAAIRFEQEWKKGTRPRIEHFLVEVDESRWPLLLEELLKRRIGVSSGDELVSIRFCSNKRTDANCRSWYRPPISRIELAGDSLNQSQSSVPRP